jgi:hypothetical protein
MEIAFDNNQLNGIGAEPEDTLDDFLRRVNPPKRNKKGYDRRVSDATSENTSRFTRGKEYKVPASETNAKTEKELRRKLALLVIDTGYKALAVKMHPDKKAGDQEAMVRLNAVRVLLKKAVENAKS